MTVGGTGSSLVQTIETLIFRAEFWTSTSPVQATGRVTSQPVMRDTGTSSASDCRLWSQNSSKGYRLNRITGCTELLVTYSRATGYRELPVPECCRFRNRSAASSGTRVLLVTEKSAVPIITGKEPASNPLRTTVSPVTEVSRLQRIDGDS